MTADARDMTLAATKNDAPASQAPADELLVRRLRDGESAAGETLVKRYHQPLLRYLQRLVGTENAAEELLQATWLSVLEHIEKFDASSGGGGFKAWLFRIATNKAHDTWRSRGREKIANENLKLIVEEESPADYRIEGAEEQEKLLWAIEQLPENQRQVLMLRFYSELKFVEIAQMLGCPLNTALGRMHKAMVKLKELMEK